MRDMWRYIHARTVVRVAARLRGPLPDRSADLQSFLRSTIEARPSFSILQVGAYDGVSNDAVHDLLTAYPHIRAVLLEPQPGPFAELQRRWEGTERVTTLRAALSDRTGQRELYMIADAHKHRHPYPDQVSSFYRSRVEVAYSRYVWRPAADAITSISVPTVDWQSLTARYGAFDFVAIDTEGYDAEILQQIDLVRSAPEIILYEHRLLDRRLQKLCKRRLESHGYSLSRVNNQDTVATRRPSPRF
jgi:FkbM family methyltransferase